LTAYNVHCRRFDARRVVSIVAVHCERPLRVADKPLTTSGILRLTDSKGGGLLYQLDKAVRA
jgi:hypothetical protein